MFPPVTDYGYGEVEVSSYNLDVTPEPLPTGLTAYIIDGTTMNGDNSILVDPDDNVHLIYKGSAGQITYANNIDGDWKAFCFEKVRNSGDYCAIAMDDKGKLHISTTISDGNNESLYYITNMSGKWRAGFIGTGLSTGMGNDIAVDRDGKIHASYWNWYKRNLHYTSADSSGRLKSETIDTALGCPTSVMIDSTGRPNITYITNRGRLSLASKNEGIWNFEELPISGQLHSAVMDEIDDIYLVCGRYMAVRNNSTWHTEEILAKNDFESDFGSFVDIDEDALAIDENKNLHYCFTAKLPYHDRSVIYASNMSGEWETSVVDEWEGGYLSAPALALDSSGNVHMSYSWNNDNMVRYVIFNPETDLAKSE